jgi:uracil-DNA glycosylase
MGGQRMKTEKINLLYKKASSLTEYKTIFGEGNINARLMLIGEAPGAKEAEQGRPFVGQAGKNLEEFLNILNIKRDEIYITNVVKIRPFIINEKSGTEKNRPPNKKEIAVYCEILKDEIQIISPSIIITLGNVALQAVMENNHLTIGEQHGKLLNHNNYLVFPLYHPAAIIYNQSLKPIYLEDLEILKEVLDRELRS